ncbi:DNA-directed DNA polymerase II small subunit [Candidatus Woesearchaeota archaeon]|nr:MAG: DNA-directed DNA polymerase II small subunit [Candidatus Woesearchaeota archaeon]
MSDEKKKEVIKHFLQEGILINPAILEKINNIPEFDTFYSNFQKLIHEGVRITNDTVLSVIDEITPTPQWNPDPQVKDAKVQVKWSYKADSSKWSMQDFINYFSNRYHKLKKILMKRKELSSPSSIGQIRFKGDREEVAAIGLIIDKQLTKNGNLIFTLEDPTGTIKVLISKNNSQLFAIAKDSQLDECVGVTGQVGDKIIFANNFFLPDIPIYKELVKTPDPAHAIFISDVHVGSNMFLHDAWNKFIRWLRAETGSEAQRNVVKKIRYLIFAGDLVEGVGIYPNQENDLEIKDIYKQYEKIAQYLAMIPDYITIIICPGNHDAMRIAEPQPELYEDYAKPVLDLPNVVSVSNPGMVNIHAHDGHPGLDILLYHGYSYVFLADQVETIRNLGGQERIDLVMKYCLQRRHLAPTHNSTQYLPTREDHLVIDTIPDIFVSGHIHRVGSVNYRNISMVQAGCWLETTEFQEKLGLKPQPGRVPLMNLQTRQVKVLKFL